VVGGLAGLVLAAVGLCGWLGWRGRAADRGEMRLQCAHYAVLRTCQMLGVPVSEAQLLALIRPHPRGHSFRQMQAALRRVGLEAQGYREDWPTLLAGPFPCIVQLKDPEHFVVLTRTGKNRIVLFDDLGQRRVAPAEAIRQRWSGAVLRAWRPRTMPEPPGEAAPWAEFETLLADAGELKGDEREIAFRFPVANRGKAPLQIVAVEAGCSCLSVEWPEVIPPGKKGVIVLKYDLTSVRPAGTSVQEALVVINDMRMPKVRLTGLVSLPSTVQVLPPVVLFGQVPQDGGPVHGYGVVLYAGDDPRELNLQPVDELPAGVAWRWVSAEEAASAAGNKGIFAEAGDSSRRRYVQITLDPAAVEPGQKQVQGALRLRTGVAQAAEVAVRFQATLVPPVEARPRMLIFRPADSPDHSVAVVQLHAARPYRVLGVGPVGEFTARPASDGPGRASSAVDLRIVLPTEQAREYRGRKLEVRLAGPHNGREFVLPLDVYVEAMASR
jgi:hypothetical protein